MKGMCWKIFGALKKMSGTSSFRSQGGSSSHHTPKLMPSPSMMDYEEEQEEQEEQAELQAEDMEIDDDDDATSTCEMTANIKPTLSSSVGTLVTPKPLTQTSSRK
jgi:hypothetical protein